MPEVNKFPTHACLHKSNRGITGTVVMIIHLVFVPAEDPVTCNQVPLSIGLLGSVTLSGLSGHHSPGVSTGHSACRFPTTYITTPTLNNLLPV